jgi:4-hydroxybenzoate polyprenyltransferase
MPRTKPSEQNWELYTPHTWMLIYATILGCLTIYILYKLYTKKLGLQAVCYLLVTYLILWLLASTSSPTPFWVLSLPFIFLAIGNAIWNDLPTH